MKTVCLFQLDQSCHSKYFSVLSLCHSPLVCVHFDNSRLALHPMLHQCQSHLLFPSVIVGVRLPLLFSFFAYLLPAFVSLFFLFHSSFHSPVLLVSPSLLPQLSTSFFSFLPSPFLFLDFLCTATLFLTSFHFLWQGARCPLPPTVSSFLPSISVPFPSFHFQIVSVYFFLPFLLLSVSCSLNRVPWLKFAHWSLCDHLFPELLLPLPHYTFPVLVFFLGQTCLFGFEFLLQHSGPSVNSVPIASLLTLTMQLFLCLHQVHLCYQPHRDQDPDHYFLLLVHYDYSGR